MSEYPPVNSDDNDNEPKETAPDPLAEMRRRKKKKMYATEGVIESEKEKRPLNKLPRDRSDDDIPFDRKAALPLLERLSEESALASFEEALEMKDVFRSFIYLKQAYSVEKEGHVERRDEFLKLVDYYSEQTGELAEKYRQDLQLFKVLVENETLFMALVGLESFHQTYERSAHGDVDDEEVISLRKKQYKRAVDDFTKVLDFYVSDAEEKDDQAMVDILAKLKKTCQGKGLELLWKNELTSEILAQMKDSDLVKLKEEITEAWFEIHTPEFKKAEKEVVIAAFEGEMGKEQPDAHLVFLLLVKARELDSSTYVRMKKWFLAFVNKELSKDSKDLAKAVNVHLLGLRQQLEDLEKNTKVN
ncbi:hypothetical protein HQ571_06720 [Candidatus Kuenenbacteria bacterium]|nr:hypothetical protein [Candidatus Kuenenbacteria bacterium]